MKLWLIMLLVMTSAQAHADSTSDTSLPSQALAPAYGLWGAGISGRSGHFRNADTQHSPALFIFGGYGAIFIEGNRFGYNFYRDGTWFASTIGQLRSQHVREEDRENNLRKRTAALEIGAQIGRRFENGFIMRFAALHDISQEHESYELDFQVFRRDRIGKALIVTTLALQYQPEKFIDYYYGDPGSFTPTDYQADSQWVQELEVLATHPLTTNTKLFLGTRAYRYQKSIENSPLAEDRNLVQGFGGIGWQF